MIQCTSPKLALRYYILPFLSDHFFLLSFFPFYSYLGLTKGDGSEEQIDTLEEVLDIITEESSDWVYGFLSFLYDVMTPFEILEEENEASEDVAGTSENEGYEGKENCVTLDLQNQ